MAPQQQAPERPGANRQESVSLSDVFFVTLRHWPWIILSVVVCVGLATLYLLRTPKVYTRMAEIQIKDDSKGQSAIGAEEFASLGLFQSNTNIQNEISNLEAKDLMEEVVRRLGINYSYTRNGMFHDEIAYGYDLPVKVSVAGSPDETGISMALAVSKEGKVTVSDLEETGGAPAGKQFSGKLGDSIPTPLGKIVVTPTPYYHKGETVELDVVKAPLSQAREAFGRSLKVSMANDKGTVIRLSVNDRSTQRADEILSTLIGVYNENWIRDKNQIAVSTSNFINDRLGVIESELGNVDSDISSYKSANLVPDVEAAASMYMSQSQQTQAEMVNVNNQLQMTRYIRSYLTADGAGQQLLPANTGVDNANIQSQIGEYNEKLLRRNALAAKSSEKNPLVTQLDEQLSSQREAIIRTVDNDIVNLNTQMKGLRGSEARITSRIASNPTQAKNLLSVERQQKVKESLYLFLLQKREENELSQAFTAYNTKIVNKPGASGIPPTPISRNILAISFLVGLFIPFGVTYVRESGNRKVRGRKDVEKVTVPFLGEIPQLVDSKGKKMKVNEGDGKVMVVREGKRDIVNEAFRVLRTNVQFMSGANEGSQVIAVTSFNPGSGKSFISVNLGKALAIKGQRVLVIDGDMRHGSTSAYAGSPAKGLADYLAGAEKNVAPLIVNAGDCKSLFILPVGSVPPNPAELLDLPRFGEMIHNLRPLFDYIIIDCPPIEVVADAQIINRCADRTFFVVRAGVLDREMLPELDRLYEEKKYRNMAFILNGTEAATGRYGYSHAYRYGYGYGYAYGNSYDSKK